MFAPAFFVFALICMIRATPVTPSTSTAVPDLCPCPSNVTEATEATVTATTPSIANHPHWTSALQSLNHMGNTIVHGMPCICNVGMRTAPIRDDYQYSSGIGFHKLHTRATTWNKARKTCNDEGGHLAIINSLAEAQVLMKIFNHSGPIMGASYPDMAYLGIHDLYQEGEWVTIFGDSLYKTGYAQWSDKWGGQPDNGSGKQNCGVILRDGDLDDVACDVPFAFFCEIPAVQHFQ